MFDAYLSAVLKKNTCDFIKVPVQESMIKEALNALGYYQPTITFSHSQDENWTDCNCWSGRISVLIYESDIVLSGEAKDDPDFLALIAKSKPSKGSILNHGNYDFEIIDAQPWISQRLLDGSCMSSCKLEVAPELNRAYIRLHYNSGIRYHFGTTTVTGSQIEDEGSIARLKMVNLTRLLRLASTTKTCPHHRLVLLVFVEPDLSQLGEKVEKFQWRLALLLKRVTGDWNGYRCIHRPWRKRQFEVENLGLMNKAIASIAACRFLNLNRSITATYKIPLGWRAERLLSS